MSKKILDGQPIKLKIFFLQNGNSWVQEFKNALGTGCTILSEWTGSAATATNAAAAAATANGINLKTDDLLALEEC